jgi:hypothetical protein
MKRRLTQIVGSVVLIGSVGLGVSTVQAQHWAYSENRLMVRRMSNDEWRGYQDGLEKGAEAARMKIKADPKEFEQYRNNGSAYKYGFRRGFNESRYGVRKMSLASYSTDQWYRW